MALAARLASDARVMQESAGRIALFSVITTTIASFLITTGGQPDPSKGGRLVDEIERLASLREQGSLTDEGFAAAKARLLR